MPENVEVFAGTGEVGPGFVELWDCIMIIGFVTMGPESTAGLIGLITLQMKVNRVSVVQ
jgi:hypothetical protein